MPVRRHFAKWWWVYALVAVLFFPWVYRQPYFHALGFRVLLLATMATSWNILSGYTGYKSLGHSTFYGLGAYAVAITARELGWNPLISAPLLAAGVAVVGLLLGWILVHTKGSAFVIATIAMLLIFRLLALNLRSITGGAPGYSQSLPPWSPEFSRMPFYYYMLFWLIVALLVSRFVRQSRFGLGLLAIRDDEGKAAMVGVHTTLYKVLAFGLSAYFVALGGGIWSYSTTHIAPIFAFDILVDVDIVLSSMLGGLGTQWGPVLGAFILAPASDLILFQFGSSAVHLAIFGGLMALIILFLSKGILPSISQFVQQRRETLSAFAEARTMAELEGPEAAVGASSEGTSP